MEHHEPVEHQLPEGEISFENICEEFIRNNPDRLPLNNYDRIVHHVNGRLFEHDINDIISEAARPKKDGCVCCGFCNSWDDDSLNEAELEHYDFLELVELIRKGAYASYGGYDCYGEHDVTVASNSL